MDSKNYLHQQIFNRMSNALHCMHKYLAQKGRLEKRDRLLKNLVGQQAEAWKVLALYLPLLDDKERLVVQRIFNTVMTPIFESLAGTDIKLLGEVPAPVLWFVRRYRRDVIEATAARNRMKAGDLEALVDKEFSRQGLDPKWCKDPDGHRKLARSCGSRADKFLQDYRSLEWSLLVEGG